TAAFIGPGTVTVCTLTGVKYGYDLLWAVLVSIIATIVLQEMAARIGLVTGQGLVPNLLKNLPLPWTRYVAMSLICIAILIGNTAYEAGNILGGTMGIQNILGSEEKYFTTITILVIGTLAFTLLHFGKYKTVEKALISLVILMSLTFIITAILTRPQPLDVLRGLFRPTIPSDIMDLIAIVGTTVVPYNIFLHASIVNEKWTEISDLSKMRMDTYVAVGLGGIISMAIILCATSVTGQVLTPTDMALALEPFLGQQARYFIGIGLFAAGVSSAITAPLAAAYVARDWPSMGSPSQRFRWTWITVLSIGVVVSCLGLRPIEVIRVAQVANGLLLPITAFYLIWLCSNESVMGSYKNSKWQIVLGVVILLTTVILGLRGIGVSF
ncbi:MAG TPA: Nramp family divalent metal transporter, partial [Membranihabitans sp.]|nr:Nramp family divalent metal transporter [Membranihabitans sp.]